ncbi:MAG: hypothetical protein ABEK59_10640 [Halobacteria archaeon]
MSNPEERHVVTAVMRNGSKVLFLRRSEDVGSYTGRWSMVSGHIDDHLYGDELDGGLEATENREGVATVTDRVCDPDESDVKTAAENEIREELGIISEKLEHVKTGESFEVLDEDTGVRWIIHPILYETELTEFDLNYENTDWVYRHPTAIFDLDTVPKLWTSYEKVAPTVETVETDRRHGSSYLSIRALEVLRDGAAKEGIDELRRKAESLVEARPSMQVLANRVNRLMYRAFRDGDDEDSGTDKEKLLDLAVEELERVHSADSDAASNAAEFLDDVVFTLSRSQTVTETLERACELRRIYVSKSCPGDEGVDVAGSLARNPDVDGEVTLVPDSAAAWVASKADALLVGADTVLPDGRVVNKVGTYPASSVAQEKGCDVYVVTSRDKIYPWRDDASGTVEDGNLEREMAEADDVLDITLEPGLGGENCEREGKKRMDGFSVESPMFETVPAENISGVVTENGVIDEDDIKEVSREFWTYSDW